MSSADLSLDISQFVSRALSGEPIDTDAAGAALADKYRHLGMSADLIGKAIVRAAAMARQALSPSLKDAPRPAGAAAVTPPTTSALRAAEGRAMPEMPPAPMPVVAQAVLGPAVEPPAPVRRTDPVASLERTLELAFQADFERAFAEDQVSLRDARPLDDPPSAETSAATRDVAAFRTRWLGEVRRAVFGA